MESKLRKRKSSRHLITSQDLIYEILLRLPAVSLMHFRRICKHWNSIISDDPMFAELHSKTRIQKLTLLFQTKADPDGWGLPQSTPDFWIYKLQESKIGMRILHRLPFRRLHPVGSSDGLLLFVVKDDTSKLPQFVVYDCVNGKQMELAGLPRDANLIWRSLLVYDSSKNMHKVLVYSLDLSVVTRTDCCYITSFSTKTLARNDGWRRKRSPFKTLILPLGYTAINGVLYWLVFGVGVKDAVLADKSIGRSLIQPFDITKEKFLNTISCPDEHFKYRSAFHTYHLLPLRGSLGLLRTTDGLKLHIWVLKDSNSSAWIQLQDIYLCSIFAIPIPSFFVLRPVFVVEHLKRLPSILLRHENKHYWYEMDGKKVEEIDFKQQPFYGRFLTAWFY